MTRKPWHPLVRMDPNPEYMRILEQTENNKARGIRVEVWGNDFYQVTARIQRDGFTHLSCKREDRYSIHDWRQLQQIKNEICGEERWAVEVYPAESMIVDTSNEYHLWVLPPGDKLPFGFDESELRTPEQIEAFNDQHKILDRHGDIVRGKARQRPWQPGLTTGLGDNRLADVLVQAVHQLDDASRGKHATEAMLLIDYIRGVYALLRAMLEDAELVDDDNLHGYLVGPSTIDKIREALDV